MGILKVGGLETVVDPKAKLGEDLEEQGIAEAAQGGDALTHASINDPFIGKTLAGRYQIDKILGSGGWGNVYLGTHLTLGTLVAIKVLHTHFARDQERQKRLEQEAKVLSRIDSQFVVKTIDYGLSPVAFIVMEYFDGSSLSEMLEERGHFEQNEAIIIFEQMCEGLAAAHSVGLIHRDLKPSNILVKITDGELRLKILDFGIAKIMDDTTGGGKLTATGEILGSPAYMSPEQWTASGVDGRSDMYSLGCLMYEILSGKPMFEAANSFEYLNLHLSVDPKPFSKVDPQLNISADLEKVVRKCVQKDPQDRYPTLEEVFEDLEKIRAGKRVTMRLKASTRINRIPARQSKAKWPVFAISFGLFAMAGAGWYFKNDLLISIASAMNQQGDHAAKQGKADQAIQAYRQSLLAAQYLPQQDPRRLHAMRALSAQLSKHGSFAEAEKIKKQVADFTGDFKPADWGQYYKRAVISKDQGRIPVAESLAKSTIALASKYGKHTIIYSLSLDLLGAVYRESERGKLALPLQQESLQIVEDLLEPDSPEIASRLNNLALCFRQENRIEDARKAYMRAIEISTRNENYAGAITPYNNLGVTYIQTNDYEKANAALERALELNKQYHGSSAASILDHMAVNFARQKKFDLALEKFRLASASREQDGSSGSGAALETYRNMAQLCLQLGRKEEALKAFERCLQIVQTADGRSPRVAHYRQMIDNIKDSLADPDNKH